MRREHPVFRAAGEAERVIFIWDDAYLSEQGWTLKRLVFVYECACAMGAEVVRGDTLAVLKGLGTERVYVAESLNPFVRTVAEGLRACGIEVTTVAEEPFVMLRKGGELGRFFRYWSRAQRSAMQPDAGLTRENLFGQDG